MPKKKTAAQLKKIRENKQIKKIVIANLDKTPLEIIRIYEERYNETVAYDRITNAKHYQRRKAVKIDTRKMSDPHREADSGKFGRSPEFILQEARTEAEAAEAFQVEGKRYETVEGMPVGDKEYHFAEVIESVLIKNGASEKHAHNVVRAVTDTMSPSSNRRLHAVPTKFDAQYKRPKFLLSFFTDQADIGVLLGAPAPHSRLSAKAIEEMSIDELRAYEHKQRYGEPEKYDERNDPDHYGHWSQESRVKPVEGNLPLPMFQKNKAYPRKGTGLSMKNKFNPEE